MDLEENFLQVQLPQTMAIYGHSRIRTCTRALSHCKFFENFPDLLKGVTTTDVERVASHVVYLLKEESRVICPSQDMSRMRILRKP